MKYKDRPPKNTRASSVYNPVHLNEQGAPLSAEINLTELFQNSLHQHLPGPDRNLIITRIDRLPAITGSREQLSALCYEIISMIAYGIRHKSKLFLYIKCEEKQDNDIIDLRLEKNRKLYSICLHTNMTTDNTWEVLFKNKLEECAAIVHKNRGSFQYHPVTHSGCLFSLIFPGKLE